MTKLPVVLCCLLVAISEVHGGYGGFGYGFPGMFGGFGFGYPGFYGGYGMGFPFGGFGYGGWGGGYGMYGKGGYGGYGGGYGKGGYGGGYGGYGGKGYGGGRYRRSTDEKSYKTLNYYPNDHDDFYPDHDDDHIPSYDDHDFYDSYDVPARHGGVDSLKHAGAYKKSGPAYLNAHTASAAPSYHKASPSYHKELPVYHKASPVYHKASPAYHKVAPSYHKASPSYHKEAPAYHHQATAYTGLKEVPAKFSHAAGYADPVHSYGHTHAPAIHAPAYSAHHDRYPIARPSYRPAKNAYVPASKYSQRIPASSYYGRRQGYRYQPTAAYVHGHDTDYYGSLPVGYSRRQQYYGSPRDGRDGHVRLSHGRYGQIPARYGYRHEKQQQVPYGYRRNNQYLPHKKAPTRVIHGNYY